MNFLSGIIVLLQKQFTIGDWIKVNGTEGVIKQIQSRYTIIKKFDGTNVIVPNAELFKHQVNSLTSNPERRFTIDLGVDLYMDLKEVIDQIYKSIDKCDKILKHPKPKILVKQPGNFSNNLRIYAWVDSKKGVLKPISILMRQIHKDFYRRGWSWPYPTQTIILDKDVPPDVNQRTKTYMDQHKKVLKKKIAMQVAAAAGVPAAPVSSTATPAGLIGPETPAWLKEAASAGATQAAQTSSATAVPPANGVVVASIQVDPVVKNVQTEPAPPPVSAPIVVAPLVEPAHAEQSAVAMPLPDVQKL